MNRSEEYRTLLRQLEDTPEQLNFTVARAKARARRRRRLRLVGTPLGSFAAACACFVLLVNLSTPFAMACSRVPVLRELAQAVSFSQSLSAAVEHDWVQPVGLTQSKNEVEMTIEYLIVDQKQLNIFYTTGGTAAPRYEVRMDVQGEGGSDLGGFGVLYEAAKPNGELQQVVIDFPGQEDSMPAALRLVCSLRPLPEEDSVAAPVKAPDAEEQDVPSAPAAVFTFDLTFDPQYTQQGELVEVGRWLELDGQRVFLRDVEIYPTHIRVNFEDDPDNTAWLRGLEFYAQDENGTRYDSPSGITATGSADSPFYASFRLDSSYFGEGEHLTLYVTGARWLDKEDRSVTVDLEAGTAQGLPEGVALHEVERRGSGVTLTFRAPMPPGEADMRFRQIFNSSYYTPEGEEHFMGGYSHTIAMDEGADGLPVDTEGYFEETFTLENYPWDTVELELINTRTTEFDQAIAVPIT